MKVTSNAKWIVAAWIVAAIVFGGLRLAWNNAYPSGTWRYKMTVAVDTPEGVKTGSAIREVTWQEVPQITPEMKPTTSIEGEAVVVDLGERGVLFALLTGYKIGDDHAKDLPFYIFPFKGGPSDKERLQYYSSLKNRSKDIEPELYPIFVRFKDKNDFKTVEALLEMERCPGQRAWPEPLCVTKDRFEEAFGKGVKVRAVTVEMTDLPVTSSVRKYMPSYDPKAFADWLKTLRYGDVRMIGPYDFVAKKN